MFEAILLGECESFVNKGYLYMDIILVELNFAGY